MDTKDTIEILRELALKFRDERNWEQFHDLKNLAMGLSIESAELMELFLWKSPGELRDWPADGAQMDRFKDELADCMIFLLYLSGAAGIDLSEALRSKIEKNARKYPVEKSYNSNKKYSDL